MGIETVSAIADADAAVSDFLIVVVNDCVKIYSVENDFATAISFFLLNETETETVTETETETTNGTATRISNWTLSETTIVT